MKNNGNMDQEKKVEICERKALPNVFGEIKVTEALWRRRTNKKNMESVWKAKDNFKDTGTKNSISGPCLKSASEIKY